VRRFIFEELLDKSTLTQAQCYQNSLTYSFKRGDSPQENLMMLAEGPGGIPMNMNMGGIASGGGHMGRYMPPTQAHGYMQSSYQSMGGVSSYIGNNPNFPLYFLKNVIYLCREITLNVSSYGEREIRELRISVYALVDKAKTMGHNSRLPQGLLN
jgi:hypothetical protein